MPFIMLTNRKKGIFKNTGLYLLAALLSIAILVWVLQLWNVNPSVPFGYSDDALQVNMLFKGVIDNDWFFHNEYIGMPTGLDLTDYPASLTDGIHFIIIKIISFFITDYAIAKNIFILLTFPLTTAAALFVFRYLNLSLASSVAGSLLFTFLPYHIGRAAGHTFLSAYYTVPFATMLALWVFAEKPLFFHPDTVTGKIRLHVSRCRTIGAIILCLFIAVGGIYYAFFACFFLLIAGITTLLTKKRAKNFFDAIILVGLISIFVFISLTPSFYHTYKYGKNKESVVRVPKESEVAGLKIAQLLFPVDDHRVPLFAKFKKYYNETAPLINENSHAALGIVGSLGFLILLGRLFIAGRLSHDKNIEIIDTLSFLNLSAILLGVVGGFSSVFSYIIDPTIRSYNRISVYIGFFSLMGFFLYYEYIFRKYKNTKIVSLFFSVFPCFILILGILDQTPEHIDLNRRIEKHYKQEARFIHDIEALMPKNAMIFQLPSVPFPEYPAPDKMMDYDHFRAYLHSKTLRWSYGAMKGRETAMWQEIVAAKPADEFLEDISIKGFSGVYLDRFGYPDKGAAMEARLSALLKRQPLISPDKRLLFFDMSEYKKKTTKVDPSITDKDLELPIRNITLQRETDNVLINIDSLSSDGPFLKASGWGFLNNTNSDGAKVYLAFISNKESFAVETIPLKRPDVTQHFKTQDFDNSGFKTIIHKKHFKLREEYRVGIYIKKDNIEGLKFTNKVILVP